MLSRREKRHVYLASMIYPMLISDPTHIPYSQHWKHEDIYAIFHLLSELDSLMMILFVRDLILYARQTFFFFVMCHDELRTMHLNSQISQSFYNYLPLLSKTHGWVDRRRIFPSSSHRMVAEELTYGEADASHMLEVCAACPQVMASHPSGSRSKILPLGVEP
jgi:hypothetical protein